MIDLLRNFLRDKGKSVAFLAVAVAFMGILAACKGWRFSDHIDVRVPPSIASATGSSLVVSLSSAEEEIWPDWQHIVTRDSQRFVESINDGKALLGFFTAMANTGLEIATPSVIGAFPAGGALLTLLGTLGGLYLRKPGDRKVIEELQGASDRLREDLMNMKAEYEARLGNEKIKSFNEGERRATARFTGSSGAL